MSASKSCNEIFQRFLVWNRLNPVYRNCTLRLLQQTEDFTGSDLLIAIPSAPEANDSLPGRNVSGSERDTPLDLPKGVSFVGGDENDRGICSRRSNFFQGLPRHEQRDVAVLATVRRTRKNETI